MKIHHIGIACLDVDEAIVEFSKFHNIIKKSQIIYDSLQNARLCLVHTDIGLDFEFISGSQVSGLLKKGISIYHICYEVDNFEQTLENYISKGAKVISDSKNAILFENRRVVFLYLSYGLIELLEAN
jgi:methylmalonyl-CoA/ethylmalonyl-CoA epimerase